jgi:1-aminocyclopropane-1-carboxylate deaminase/D-cysteine desulfhydrase-like pyridoxal-dependent ACC family enzyme
MDYALLLDRSSSMAEPGIFTATGTGGTLAGLAAGRHLTQSKARITAIAVSDKKADYEANCAALANESLKWLGSDARVDAAEFTLDRGYFAPGYERPNEGATEAIRLLARSEGLLIDPVYTGKAFAGLLGNIRSGMVAPGSTVVFWHTGGATALFAEREILGALTEA